jgi:RNA polymerase sigma factor (sigma-70 family)
LVLCCQAGDAQAWAVLVQRYQRLVYAIVRRLGEDEHGAADVFQTVFTRLLQHLPRLNDASRLQAWIVTTAKREALLQRRRAQRTVSSQELADAAAPEDPAGTHAWEATDSAAGPEQQLSELQQLHALRLAMDRLDSRCLQLLQSLFYDDGPRPAYGAVASQLGVPVGSIGPTRARCLAKLRALM